MEIGHTIAKLRNEHNLSQKMLASELKLSTSSIALWETNKRLPSLEALISIAGYFNVSVDSLLGKNEINKSPIQIRQPILSESEKKLLDTFQLLNTDYQDILIGEAKKLLHQQKIDEKSGISLKQAR